MSFLRNLTMRQRLLGSALLLCAIIVAMGAWSEISLRGAQAHASRLLDTQAETARETTNILAALERVQRLEQSVMLNGSNANEAGEHHAQWKKTVAQTRGLLKRVMSTPERAQALAPAAAGFDAHVKPLEDILQQTATLYDLPVSINGRARVHIDKDRLLTIVDNVLGNYSRLARISNLRPDLAIALHVEGNCVLTTIEDRFGR